MGRFTISVTFGWDASHYDGTLTAAIMQRAAAEGIQFFTHKLGEGLGNADPTAATALAAARDAGIRALGGYWFNHGSNRPADEVSAFIAEANQHEPWWRDFPGWFWQADLERSPTGLPSPAWAREFCDRLLEQTGRTVVAYGSHGQYGDALIGLGHPLWNASYPSSRRASFKDLYPGDSYSGWNPYSGQTPVFAQYTSSATIAGLTTCDANAFRGSIDELLELIGADMALTAADADVLVNADVIDNTGGLAYRTDSPGHVPPPASPNARISIQTALQSIAGQAASANVGAAAALSAVGALAVKVGAITPQAVAAAVVAALPAPAAGGLTEADVEEAVHAGLGKLGLTVTVAP